MRSEDRNPGSKAVWRTRVRLAGFCIYAAATLLSQAVMSIAVALLFASIVAGAGGFGPLWRQLRETVSRPGVRGFFRISVAFIFVIILSLVGTWLWPVTYKGHSPGVSLPADIGKIWYFIAPFVFVTGLLAMSAGERRVVLRTWILTLLALGAVAVIQFFTGWPRAQVIPTHPSFYHATLFLGHHLSVSSVLIFPFFAVVDLFSDRDGWRRIGLNRGLLGVAFVAGLVTLVLTFSRAVWGAIPIALIAWSCFKLGRRAVYAAVAIVAVAAALSQVPAVNKRFNRGAVSDRQELWVANFDFFKARPVLGLGFRKNHEMSGYYLKEKYPTRTWVFAGHAHNNLLDMLGGMGVAGLLVWLVWCGWVIWLPYKAWRSAGAGIGFPAGLVAAWVAFQVNGVTQVNFWEGKVMHQMMWAAAWGLLFYIEGKQDGSRRALVRSDAGPAAG